jgi:hypothetical protein
VAQQLHVPPVTGQTLEESLLAFFGPRARSDPAAFDRGLAQGHGWRIDRAVAIGLGGGADPDADPE